MTTVNVGELEFRVVDRGTGRPLVLLHGFPLDHSMWHHQIEAFALNYRVIAIDLRGFGRSSITPGAVAMEQYALDVDSLLAKLGVEENFVLCGLSMGGYIAFEYYRNFPQKPAGLILCDTRATPDSESARTQRIETAEKVLRDGPNDLADAMVEKLFSAETLKQRRDLVNDVRNVMLRTHPEGIAAALRGMAMRPDSTPLLAQITTPTLVLVGEHDAITPAAEMESMAAQINGARFEKIARAGHMAPLEQPQAVNAAIDRYLSAL